MKIGTTVGVCLVILSLTGQTEAQDDTDGQKTGGARTIEWIDEEKGTRMWQDDLKDAHRKFRLFSICEADWLCIYENTEPWEDLTLKYEALLQAEREAHTRGFLSAMEAEAAGRHFLVGDVQPTDPPAAAPWRRRTSAPPGDTAARVLSAIPLSRT